MTNAILKENRTPPASDAASSVPFDEALSRELDRVETAIAATEKTLNPLLWSAARKTPAATRIVMEAIKALADLHQERDALERRAGLAG